MSRRTLSFLFALLSLSAATALAQSQIRIVRLSYVEGDVQLDRNTGEGLTKAFLNLPIVQGARLSTGSDGYAEAELEDGSAIRLTPNSLMEFTQLERDNTGTQTTVHLVQGEAYFQWNQNHNDAFRVRVVDQLFTPKKKSHFRISATDAESAVAVFGGELEMFRSNGEKIDVKKNETLSLTQNDADRYFLTKSIAPDALDDWDHDRQSELERETIAQQNAYANLNQFGSYITVPDYGSVWRPAGFGYEWNPYQDGSWVYYPTCGYVWVSSYPWGWAPYRYGTWVFVNNVGWGWRPGPYRNGWNTSPVFIHPPGGYHPPVPPEHHHDGVILVGRPPHDFDLGDHRWHHPVVVGAADAKTSTPAMPNSNTVMTGPRTDRTVRGVDAPVGSGHRDNPDRSGRLASAPANSNPPSTTTPPASQVVTPPRSSRTERTPAQPSEPETRGRPYTPPPAAAPQHYTPPPSAPAQHYEPPPQHSSPPPQSYSPPPAQSPAPAPAPSHGRDVPK